MNEVESVLREIGSRGLTVTVSGSDLRLQGPAARIDKPLVDRIKAVKPELIAALSRPGTDEAAGAVDADAAGTAAGTDEPAGFPLTLLQRGYLIGREGAVEMGRVSSHIYHEIAGHWDVDRLEAALGTVVNRHGMLRTRFTADGTQVEEPAPLDVRIERLDLRGVGADARAERLAALRREYSHRVLPADRAPLLAAQVTVLDEDRMLLQVGHDGLIMDAVSIFLFFQDWWAAYNTGEGGDTSGAVAGVDEADHVKEASFAAYVAALETARTRAPYQRSRKHWLDRIDELAPHPDLPLAASPAAIARPRFTQHTVRFAPAQWTALKSRAAQAGLTPTVLLLAAYAETLACWGAGERFTLNTTLANRLPIHPRITEAIGNFSETMLVEIEVDRAASFAQRAAALQARMRRDLDNRHFSGIEVLRELGRREGAARARMPYAFNSSIGYVRAGVDGSALELFGPEIYTSSQTPQLWLNAFAFEQHGGLVVQFDEVEGLFPAGLIEAVVAGYRTLVTALLGEEAWAARSFDLLPDEQRARRRAANDTAAARPEAQLQDAVLAQADRAPDAPAVITSQGTLTYRELLRRALDAAAWLRVRAVRRDEPVGLAMTRGPEQIVGILAAVLAGAAYLPIDATLPERRKGYMLRDGRVRCVLTNTEWQDPDDDDGSGGDIEVLRLGSGHGDSDGDGANGGDGLSAEAGAEVGADAPSDGKGPQPPYTAVPGASPDDLAYVLYTSGTTGEPKGVMVTHRAVANVVADCNARFGIGPADRFFGISAFHFDLSVFDVFGALSAGAAIVLPDADKAADPAHWLELCAATGVTVWNSVPAIVSLLCEQIEQTEAVGEAGEAAVVGRESGGPPAALRLVMMSGDRVPPTLPARLRALKPDLRVVSLGGPTETTVWNILHPVGADEDGSQPIPYGRPNANNRAYILGADGRDAPDWISGEIHAAGVGLARGYWGDEARTAERFFHDAERGERLYRTGDLGRYRPDGEIEILGRADFQVKVNGYRIETGEVETRLAAIPAVKQAAVVRRSAAHGDRLVAHLVPGGDERPSPEEIRRALREHLPDYMTPSAVVWHESLPLTRNGKVDRARLTASADPRPDGGAAADGEAAGAARRGPATQLERQIGELWASVLRLPRADGADSTENASNAGATQAAGSATVAVDADFYELGGDSLAAARILTGVRKRFGVGITLDHLHEVLTVRAMAARVEQQGEHVGTERVGTAPERAEAAA